MAKRGKGGGYRPAPWSDDFDPKKRGGKAPWHRKRPFRFKGEKSPWSDPLAPLRGGGR